MDVQIWGWDKEMNQPASQHINLRNAHGGGVMKRLGFAVGRLIPQWTRLHGTRKQSGTNKVEKGREGVSQWGRIPMIEFSIIALPPPPYAFSLLLGSSCSW